MILTSEERNTFAIIIILSIITRLIIRLLIITPSELRNEHDKLHINSTQRYQW